MNVAKDAGDYLMVVVFMRDVLDVIKLLRHQIPRLEMKLDVKNAI